MNKRQEANMNNNKIYKISKELQKKEPKMRIHPKNIEQIITIYYYQNKKLL